MKVFLVLLAVGVAVAQVPSLGGCPKVSTVTKLDINKYSGTWYEQKRFPAIFEFGRKCVKADYSMNDDGTIKVVNSGIKSWSGSESSTEGVGRIPNPKKPGQLKVRFSRNSPEGDYWILSTDYKNYSLVYSCSDYWVLHTEYAWVLTRNRTKRLSTKILKKIKKILAVNKVDARSFIDTDQTGCE